MTTITALRQNYVNTYLARGDTDTLPWSSDDVDQHLADAIASLWPVHGLLATGEVATDSLTQEYAIPAGITRVSRIDVLDSSGYYLSQVTNWRLTTSDTVVIHPILVTGYTLKFTGWAPFDMDGSDLPTRLEDVVAKLATAGAYGQLAANLTNSQRQQTLDSGRMVDYDQAIALDAYWRRLAESRLFNDPSRVSYAPRRARRG